MFLHKITILSVFVLFIALGFYFMPDAYWIDWDNLMYMANVKIHMSGSHDFSFMHNLINTYIYRTFLISKTFFPDISIYKSTQALTIFFGTVNSLAICFSIKYLTHSWLPALIGGTLWFLFPGNILLYHTIEDNVWSSAFVSLLIFTTIKTYNISFSQHNIHQKVSWFWIIVSATIVSIGINIHQQVGLMCYVFITMTIFAPSIKLKEKCFAITLFFIVYILGSVSQNYLAFKDFELFNSIQRLYHNPYQTVFPKLYYFSSGLSLNEWCGLILKGWKQTLLYDGVAPAFMYFVVAIIFTFLVVSNLNYASLQNFSGFFKKALWLSPIIILLIPYSLLFEPQNVERWDSCIPGIIIMVVTICYFAGRHIHDRLSTKGVSHSSSTIILLFAITFSLCTLVQSVSFMNKKRADYQRNGSVHTVNQILDFISQRDNRENLLLLLDQKLKTNDIQTLITLEFPEVSYIVLNNHTLRPMFSSRELNGNGPYPDMPIYQLDLPERSVIGIMPGIFNTLKSVSPAFLESPGICEGTIFICDLTHRYAASEDILFSFSGPGIFNNISINQDISREENTSGTNLRVVGYDPAITLPALEGVDENRNIVLRFKFRSSNATVAKIYYKYQSFQAYSEKMTLKSQVHIGDNDLFFLLPKGIVLTAIRFDISEEPGLYSLDEIAGKIVELPYN